LIKHVNSPSRANSHFFEKLWQTFLYKTLLVKTKKIVSQYLVSVGTEDLYFAFIGLEKAFDCIPRRVLWWAMRKLGIAEWVVKTVLVMYHSPKSLIRLNGKYSEDFPINVGVHQGSVLSPLLFILVMEALSRDLRSGCPWELIYADGLSQSCAMCHTPDM